MKIKKWIILFFACLAIFVFMVCSNKSRLADDHFQKGQVFEKSNRPDSALVQYRLAIQANPRHMKANIAYQDMAIEKFGKYNEIWDAYDTLAKKHPSDPAFQVLFIRLQDNNDRKIEDAIRIVERNPGDFWTRILLGTAYEKYSNRDYGKEAINAYESAVKLDSTESDVYARLARLYGRNDEFKKMKACGLRALALDSSRTDLYAVLWENDYLAVKNKDSVKTVLRREIDNALVKYGRDVRFLNSIRNIMYELDRERYDRLKKEITDLDPKGEAAQDQTIDRLYDEKDARKGLQKAEAFLDSFPDSRYTKNAFGMWLTFARQRTEIDDAKVEQFARVLIQKYPGRMWIFEKLYGYYSDKYPDQYDKLENLTRPWLETFKGKNQIPVLTALGKCSLKLKRFDNALITFLRADSLSRKYRRPSSVICSSLGEVYERKGELDRAMECYSQSLGLGDDDAVLDRFYAAYEKKFGSREGARKFINQRILSSSAVKNPYPAPEFALATATNDTLKLSGLRGKVVLIAAWNPG